MAVAQRVGEKFFHGSQFFITTMDNQHSFDGKFTVFGQVVEGLDVLAKINEAYCDDKGRPFRNVRIKHVVVLEDPFLDPAGWTGSSTASPPYQPLDHRKEADDLMLGEANAGKTKEQIEEEIAAKEAKSRADVLVMVGDIQDADAKPPDDVLFICKMHPVTQEDDLEVIFGRFGPLKKVEIIRDRRTNESLGYGFIHFETREACVAAYTKMDNVLIDEKRVHVDFCQSVPKLWKNRLFGVALPPGAIRNRSPEKGSGKGSHSKDRRRSRSRSRSRSREVKKEKKKRSRSRSRERRRSRSRSRERRKRSRSRSRERSRRK